MDTRSEIREFLTSRRARITPEQVGLATYGGRRVPGLRREEVAVLAGVSAPYYTRIERGEMNGVSDSVLLALSRALQLDEAEHAHLFDLARAVQPTTTPRRRRATKQPIRPSVQHILDAITGAAAFVRNDRPPFPDSHRALQARRVGRAVRYALRQSGRLGLALARIKDRDRPARRLLGLEHARHVNNHDMAMRSEPAVRSQLAGARLTETAPVHVRSVSELFIAKLDDRELAKPSATIWVSAAPSWACIDQELPRVQGQPPPVA